FGRERDQRIIAANLGAAPLTILYGASGVGKSSVLLAGVVPYLRAWARAVAVVRDWQGPGFRDALKSRCREAVERVCVKPFLIALREDGLAKLDRFGGRIPNLLGNTLRLQHLTAADAVTAIRKPLEVFNERHVHTAPMAIEDALVDAIIEQVRSGQVTLGRS